MRRCGVLPFSRAGRGFVRSYARGRFFSRGIFGKNRVPGLLLVAGWLIAVFGGMLSLALHEAEPGFAASKPTSDNADLKSILATNGPTLLMFVHPKCPCSAASVEELARLANDCEGRLKVVVLVLQPSNEPPSWSHTSLWQSAQSIPGVSVESDVDAKLARQLGVITSGQVLLYDRSGNLEFSGGITASRGHAGDNDGADAIVAHVLGRGGPAALIRETPVFGCALYSWSSGGETKQ
jgi:hypothetical protein